MSIDKSPSGDSSGSDPKPYEQNENVSPGVSADLQKKLVQRYKDWRGLKEKNKESERERAKRMWETVTIKGGKTRRGKKKGKKSKKSLRRRAH